MTTTAGPRLRVPARPRIALPYAFRELRTPGWRHYAAHGGRGAAKSHSIAQELILWGAEQPLRILCAREIQRSIAASVKQLLDDKIGAAGMGSFYDSTQYAIRGANGTEFLFAGLRTNPESVKSTEGIDVAWVEEANTVSQRSINLLTPTVRKPGSRLIWSWNRRFVTDPVDNMFLGQGPRPATEARFMPPPRSLIRRINHDDNPWFPEVLREELEWDKARDFDKYLHVWEGEPISRSESKVFKHWKIEDIDDQVPPGTTPRFGADWGFGDPTVLVKCYAFGRTLYFREEAYKVALKIQDTPALFKTVTESQDYDVRADSSRPDTIAHMRDNGFPRMRPAAKGPGSVEDGIEFMRSYDIVVHPDCPHIAAELATYSYKTDPLTDEILPELEDKNNHTIDSARYALEGYRRGVEGGLDGLGGLHMSSVVGGLDQDIIDAARAEGADDFGAWGFSA